MALTSFIVNDPNFADDVTLWFTLSEVMQDYRPVWAQWQGITAPTARLEAYHQAVTDALYNLDQAAIKFEVRLELARRQPNPRVHRSHHGSREALNRATRLLGEWEAKRVRCERGSLARAGQAP